jgi:hypothetical protein
MELAAPSAPFAHALRTHQNPGFLAPLSHLSGRDGPPGRVEGIVSAGVPLQRTGGVDLVLGEARPAAAGPATAHAVPSTVQRVSGYPEPTRSDPGMAAPGTTPDVPVDGALRRLAVAAPTEGSQPHGEMPPVQLLAAPVLPLRQHAPQEQAGPPAGDRTSDPVSRPEVQRAVSPTGPWPAPVDATPPTAPVSPAAPTDLPRPRQRAVVGTPFVQRAGTPGAAHPPVPHGPDLTVRRTSPPDAPATGDPGQQQTAAGPVRPDSEATLPETTDPQETTAQQTTRQETAPEDAAPSDAPLLGQTEPLLQRLPDQPQDAPSATAPAPVTTSRAPELVVSRSLDPHAATDDTGSADTLTPVAAEKAPAKTPLVGQTEPLLQRLPDQPQVTPSATAPTPTTTSSAPDLPMGRPSVLHAAMAATTTAEVLPDRTAPARDQRGETSQAVRSVDAPLLGHTEPLLQRLPDHSKDAPSTPGPAATTTGSATELTVSRRSHPTAHTDGIADGTAAVKAAAAQTARAASARAHTESGVTAPLHAPLLGQSVPLLQLLASDQVADGPGAQASLAATPMQASAQPTVLDVQRHTVGPTPPAATISPRAVPGPGLTLSRQAASVAAPRGAFRASLRVGPPLQGWSPEAADARPLASGEQVPLQRTSGGAGPVVVSRTDGPARLPVPVAGPGAGLPLPRPTAGSSAASGPTWAPVAETGAVTDPQGASPTPTPSGGFTEVVLQRQAEAAGPPDDQDLAEPTGGVGAASGVGPAPATAAAPALPSGRDLDELAERLYEPLSARLRAELWLDRERSGLIVELRQ